ncbi:MAG: pyruvate dehydrogenase (acetyl-transferring) E1 component subunit alpha [Candidatus Aminicenantes bacterium]|nr:pyruvate dehydrogenase (acetyl-transferring) E1 component subunit alpha [Candidatus Aminicenantes bacterium]
MLTDAFDAARGERVGILDPDGRVLRPDLLPALTPDDLRRVLALMILTREADRKALLLQRQGRLGTFASSLGHEACQVGSAFGLRAEDWAFPYFRDMGLYLTVGYPLATYYHYWMGNEAGFRTPDGLNLFPFAIPVASQIPQAVGAALAAKHLGKPLAVLTTFGDGATSEGDFHEGLNFAGVHRAPVVFVCYNNQWAISTPISRQTASASIAQKAAAYGFPGLAVDGNDVLAMIAAVREALDRARSGGGPTLIEAFTYRMSHHTTSDDASRYRSREEVETWERRDPLARFRAYLAAQGYWDQDFEGRLGAETGARIEAAVAEAEKTPPASLEDLFVFTYKEIPARLAAQLAERKMQLGGAR